MMRIELPEDQVTPEPTTEVAPEAPRRPRLRRRTVITLASAMIPLAFDAAFVHALQRVRPENETLFINIPGLIIGISWGLLAVLICMCLGMLIGLPVALVEAMRYRPGRRQKLGATSELVVTIVPWMIAFLFAFFLGISYVFPPVGGPLLMMNTLLARVVPSVLGALVRLWQPIIVEESRRG